MRKCRPVSLHFFYHLTIISPGADEDHACGYFANVCLHFNMLTMAGKFAPYSDTALKPFTEKLLSEYYNTIEDLCASAGKQAQRVSSLESESAATEYAALCSDITGEIIAHMQARKQQMIPYIHQLVEKKESNHDCRACSGGCKVNHDLQVLNMKASNTAARKVIGRLQLATLPLYSHTMYPDEYRVLRNRMALLEMSMSELFFIENNYLIPKILETQKSINADRH